MPALRSKKAAPKEPKETSSAEAKARILDAAERLLGERGLHGASLREISAASGQANNSAVQYHFKDKEGLVRAIIERRAKSFEPRRRELLEMVETRGASSDVRELLKVLFLPLAEAADPEHGNVYARFLMQFLIQIRYNVPIQHPGWAPDDTTVRTGTLLLRAVPHLDMAALICRIDRLAGLFLSAIIERENALARNRGTASQNDFLADLLSMMAAALTAPLSTEV